MKYGPIAMHINGANRAFQFNFGSVINSKRCTPKSNHVVLAIGFGVDPNTNRDYVIIQNSWGRFWGNKGFAKIDAGTDVFEKGMCGIY
jgi:xylem cysteine proteinase/KDEL-tailed cysteine endopeptidase